MKKWLGVFLFWISLINMVVMSSERPLSICQLLQNLEVYREKMVTVQGVVLISQMEGSALYDWTEEPCHGVEKQWPAGIYLAWPNDPNPEDGPRNFRPNNVEIEKNYRPFAIQAPKEGKLVLATIVGELRARKGIKIVQPRGEATSGGDGYGNLGQYPAQLIIKTVLTAKLIDKNDWPPLQRKSR